MSTGAPPEVPGNRWDLLDRRRPAQPPSVSVVVVHHEQPRQLDRLKAALAAQTHPAARTEVLVVDDGSRHPPVLPRGWRLLTQEHRGVRPGAARNLGAAMAGGDVLCFLDADTAPEPDYLSRLTRLPGLLEEAVTVGRRRHADFTGVAPETPLTAGAAPELEEPRWLRDGYRRSGNLLRADDRSYRFIISAVLACTRAFFADTGPFAEFDAYGGEDWEWAHRAWRNGAVFAHVPDAVAWHDGPHWGARAQASARAVKNDETLRLAALIGVRGCTGRAIAPARSEYVVSVLGEPSAAATYVCVDGILAALPATTVILADSLAARMPGEMRIVGRSRVDPERVRWPALTIEIHRPAAVDPIGLRDRVERLLADDAPGLEVRDRTGALMTIRTTRAARRAARRGCSPVLDAEDQPGWAAALQPDIDLEGYVGGWWRPITADTARGR